jgi:hypothetical protein
MGVRVHNLSIQSAKRLDRVPGSFRLHGGVKWSSRVAAACWATAAVVGVFLAGCRGSPLTAKDERSPYDRYDAVRNQRAEPYVEDKFGKRIPNLRDRLAPRN